MFYLKSILIFQHWKWPAQATGTVPIVSAHYRFLEEGSRTLRVDWYHKRAAQMSL